MTTTDLATLATPYIRNALRSQETVDGLSSQLGTGGWLIARPFWKLFTGPMLPYVTRLAIEVAIAIAGPKVSPILDWLVQFVKYISEDYITSRDKELIGELSLLVTTPQAAMLPGVQAAVSGEPQNPFWDAE